MFCDNIDIERLEYKPPTSNRNGGKVVHVSTIPGSTDWRDRIRFQMSENENTNLQNAVWGLSTPLPGQDASRRTLELSIESPELQKFLERMDEHNLRTASANAQDWFKKPLGEEAIKGMYARLVREPQKADQKPSVRVKVKCAEYPTNIYVVDGTDLDGNLTYSKGTPEDLTRNAKCLCMVETMGLWFMSRQFGMSLTASEILVWPNRRPSGIAAFTMSKQPKLSQSPATPLQQVDDIDMED